MEIKVEGRAKKSYKPNQMILNFEFTAVKPNQNEAIECGLQSVSKYIDFLTGLKIKREDIQTKNMIVQQNKQYNEALRKYENVGYEFIQSVSITLNYNLDLIATLVAETAKFSTPPNYEISFGIKDENKAKEEILALAYKDAEVQAKVIAVAAGKQIADCISVSFEPFQGCIVSPTNFGLTRSMAKFSNTIDYIKNTFIPADINVEKTVYCVFATKS